MWNPLSWVMEAAAIIAIAVPHGEVIPSNEFSFYLQKFMNEGTEYIGNFLICSYKTIGCRIRKQKLITKILLALLYYF